MKHGDKYSVIVCLLLWAVLLHPPYGCCTTPAGVGVMVGDPTGITAKYRFDATNAMDLGIGLDDFSIHADYLWHDWNLFPQSPQTRLAAYYGFGAGLEDRKHDSILMARALGGVSLFFTSQPFELFAELVPVLKLTGDSGLDLDAAIGVRYYF